MEYSKELTLTDDADLQLPIEIWERHFVEDPGPQTAIIQPTGPRITVWIWSPRDLLEIELPVRHWVATKPYKRSLTGNRIDFSRWRDVLELGYGDEMATVRSTIRPHSADWVPTMPT